MLKTPILPGSVYDCEVIFTDVFGSKTRPVIILSGPHKYMNIKQIVSPLATQLSWSHFIEVLPLKDGLLYERTLRTFRSTLRKVTKITEFS